MGFIFKFEKKGWRGILWGLLVKNPFLTCFRLRDPRKRLWSPSSFLRVNTVIAIASLAMMPAAARQKSSLDPLAVRRRLPRSALLSILHDFLNFYFNFKKIRSRQEELLLLIPPSSLFPAEFCNLKNKILRILH
jgi:hypothetical protein